MNAAGGLDLLSIPDRIQSEVQRAIQRSIKGVEYISSSGPHSDRRRRTSSMSAAP